MLNAENRLLLHNAIVLTMDTNMPRASWVYVEGLFIKSVGIGTPPRHLISANTRLIDCQGMTLMPGFNDAHIHIFATVSTSMGVDCSDESVSSVSEIGEKLMERAAITETGSWIKGFGYREFNLLEKRHPTRWDLDKWVPHHPVRLRHGSGHAMVLNSIALELVGISTSTPDPIYGVIDRIEETREPTGLLLEMNQYIDGMIPSPSQNDMDKGLRQFNRACIQMGITSLQDANPLNSLKDWHSLLSKTTNRLIEPDVRMMAGVNAIEEFIGAGLVFGSSMNSLTLSSVKIIAGMTTGVLYPTAEELKDNIRYAGENGFQVAIHGIEAEVNAAIVTLLDEANDLSGTMSNRIEHLSECPQELISDLREKNITVVTQPGFVYYMGDRYKEEVPKNRQEWLYRIGSLYRSGVNVGIGSDSPVIPMSPMNAIYSAVTRKTASGGSLNPNEAVSVEDVLKMYTLGSAYAGTEQKTKGCIKPGYKADLVLLDSNPITIEHELIKSVQNVMTIISGEVLWRQ